ncbi:hypothetical protein EY643_14530 [Halioglobus maricola]|uniref:Phytanoyl-CoA dioxygenase n=1 Tax=Halioglobus maricola TaxID=2601894 RepID=A0A5P9NLQ9_9GAMM|nr:hypothetical protein [Halioglobus maricola]QFU76770.1 hypothetical protein EY643_14530 [Halioglobus maricola]
MKLTHISDTLLDEASSPALLREALDAFSDLCSAASGIVPDRSFDAWAGDSLLDNGVAINPQAAAHCVTDYQRSVIYIRGAYAAIKAARERFNGPIQILYPGCGPFATLLLPLLEKFHPDELEVHLLDIHQQSLESVSALIQIVGLDGYRITYVQDDACHYQHPTRPHVIIVETMQKSLEQEPQFAVTANLAPQLHERGIFIPQKIEVELCLADLDSETAAFKQGATLDPDMLTKTGKRHPLDTVLSLTPQRAAALLQNAQQDDTTGAITLNPVYVTIPPLAKLENFDAVLFTRVQAFEQYQLLDYESEITLPLRCSELAPLRAGTSYRVSFRLGSYPKFCIDQGEDE